MRSRNRRSIRGRIGGSIGIRGRRGISKCICWPAPTQVLIEGDQAGDTELFDHPLMIGSQVGHRPPPALEEQIQEGSDEWMVKIDQDDDRITGAAGVHDRGIGRIVCRKLLAVPID